MFGGIPVRRSVGISFMLLKFVKTMRSNYFYSSYNIELNKIKDFGFTAAFFIISAEQRLPVLVVSCCRKAQCNCLCVL